MAHELENRNDMTYVGQTPWHGLGEQVESIDELPRCLDWQVEKLPMFFYPNGDARQQTAGDYRALVRSDNDTLLGIVTDQYQPHQNDKTWKVFADFAKAGDMALETAGALKGGKTIWALAKLNRSFGATDRQELYALLATAHDGTMATTCRATSIRVVCANTLSIALASKNNNYRQSHKSKFDPRAAQDFVAQAILGFDNYKAKVESLQSVTFNGYNRAISEAFVAELLAPEILNKAIEQTHVAWSDISTHRRNFVDDILMADASRNLFVRSIEHDPTRPFKLALHDVAIEQRGVAGQTPWGLVNGITRYVDHTHGRNQDNRLSNAWFGAGDSIKSKALDLAIEYTQALRTV